MTESQYETVAILAKLIRKAHAYDVPLRGRVLAVPVDVIAEALEQFTTTQVAPTHSLHKRMGENV